MRRLSYLRLALEEIESSKKIDPITENFRNTFKHLLVNPALEEEANGKAEKEIEFTIYARMIDPEELTKSASMEHQEQWEIRIDKTDKNAGKGTFRVRKTWLDGQEPVYTRTSKVVINKETGDKLEIVQPSNADEFNVFKFLSPQGMVKDRYNFPIVGTDLVWEIDCYPKPDGGYYEWVKIDLEVPDRGIQIPEFPISLEDVILPEDKGREPGQGEKITEIYDQCFLAKNQYLEAKEKGLDAPVDASKDIATGEPTDKPENNTEVTSDAATVGAETGQASETPTDQGNDTGSKEDQGEKPKSDDQSQKSTGSTEEDENQ